MTNPQPIVCPDCGHPVEMHIRDIFDFCVGDGNRCLCKLSNGDVYKNHIARQAAVIERVETENVKLREAIAPFAKEGEEWSGNLNMAPDSDYPIIRWEKDDDEGKGSPALFSVGDLRRIASAAKYHQDELRRAIKGEDA